MSVTLTVNKSCYCFGWKIIKLQLVQRLFIHIFTNGLVAERSGTDREITVIVIVIYS